MNSNEEESEDQAIANMELSKLNPGVNKRGPSLVVRGD